MEVKLRKLLTILFVLVLATSLTAQVRTGNVYGKVADPDGNPLPGVTVTLTGSLTAPLTSISSAEGVFRFLSLPPSSDYTVKAELEGFKTEIRESIIIVIGANVEVNITMEMGALEEEVTVTAVTPVVDTKKTSVGANVTQDILQSLPTSRDPWVVLSMAPSVIIDRENVGGAESGQQSGYTARGSTSGAQNVWAMDGMVITDPAAIGASPSYYDFDAFEEMNITVGGADVTVQTGGVALNMVTRRGGNRVSLGGRFYLVDGEKFQSKAEEFVAETQEVEPSFLGVNLIRENKDYGFNLGFPIIQDKAWFWGSWGVQDVKTQTVYQRPDDTLLQNVAAKLNLQIIPENRFEAFAHIGRKNKYGRSSSAALPGGYFQGGRYHFGSPIVKIQDEHMFGDSFFVSIKFGFSDAGFNLTPMDDLDFEKTPFYDITNSRWEGPDGLNGDSRYYVERPVTQFNFLGNYFNDTLFGASHDIKFGVEYADRASYTESVREGNMNLNWNYNTSTVDFDGDGSPDNPQDFANAGTDFYYINYFRGNYSDFGVKALAAYFSDTITFGRFNLLLGLRYDIQTPRINDITRSAMDASSAWDNVAPENVQNALDALLPAIDIPGRDIVDLDGNTYSWKVFSPRLGMTWDVTGDGKTIAKLSVAKYGNFMGVGSYGQFPGGASGYNGAWWWDHDSNGTMALNELYWHTVDDGKYTPYNIFQGNTFVGNWDDADGVFWGSYEYDNPSKLVDPYQIRDADAGSSLTWEAMATVERELLTDLAIQLNLSYRRYDHFTWTKRVFRDDNGAIIGVQSQDWYEPQNVPVSNINQYLADDYKWKQEWGGDLGAAPDNPWYTYKTSITLDNGETINPADYTPHSWVQRMPNDRYNDYFGLDLVFNKRLSNRWMLNGSFTIQKQAYHYGTEGYLNATNVWALEGQSSSAFIGGASGKISQYTYTPWMFKVGGLYQLPWDFNVSFNFNARDGHILRERMQLFDYTLPNTRSRSSWLYLNEFGNYKLDVFYNLDLRIEKVLRSGDFGRIYIMADLFNALNSTHENRRYQRDWGNFYYYGAGDSRNRFREDTTAFTLNEILNPRVMRLGVRFQF
jgi:hypothetical protein